MDFSNFFFLIKLNNNLYLLLNKLKNKLYLRAFEQTENSTVNMPIKQVFIYIYFLKWLMMSGKQLVHQVLWIFIGTSRLGKLL